MALGFHHLARDRAVAWSDGSEPEITVNPAAIAAMAERGIDISREFPKPWTDETVRAADVVITHGLRRRLPDLPRETLRGLGTGGPAGRDIDGVQPVRDAIERRIRALLDELKLSAATVNGATLPR